MASDMFKKNLEDLGMKSHTPIYMWDAPTQEFVPMTYEELEERDVIKSVKKEPIMDDKKYYVSLTFVNMSAQDVGRLINNINEFSQMSRISVDQM